MQQKEEQDQKKNEHADEEAASLATSSKGRTPAEPSLDFSAPPQNKLDGMSQYYEDLGVTGRAVGERNIYNGSWFWAPNHPKPHWLRGCRWMWIVDGAGNQKEKCIPLNGEEDWGWTDADHYRWKARHRRRGTWMHIHASDWTSNNHKLETFAAPRATDDADELTVAVHSRGAMPEFDKVWRDPDQSWLKFELADVTPGASQAPKRPSLI